MKEWRARITYLGHSGFALETAESILFFDYCPYMAEGNKTAESLLAAHEHAYVFVSHNHGDHFDPAIFCWSGQHADITYVLSSDVEAGNSAAKTRVMPPYAEWTDRRMRVKTYGSTDAGVSFLVRTNGLSIFHAGDLNWWRWKGETAEEQDYAERIFKAEIEKMAGERIDIAFFPVDRRLEEYYCLGAEYFAAKMHPALLVPMHFGKDYGATEAFAARTGRSGLNTVVIGRQGQEFIF